MTHDDLIKIGRRWMKSKAPVVITEIASGASEQPDIISFETIYKIGSGSVVIECKMTRADYKMDKKKFHRRSPNIGMGSYRYYLTPKNLIEVSELPEKWGLLETSPGGRVRIIKKAEHQESNSKREVILLVSVLRRLKIETGEHISLRVYTTETKNKATLTLEEENDK